MLRKTIKKVASVILAIALMVTYIPMVAIAADEEPITAESYQALIDEVAAAEAALAEAEAALETSEDKLAAEEAVLAAAEALATVKAELAAVEANIIEAKFIARIVYVDSADGSVDVFKRLIIGTGLAYRNENGSYTIITIPEDVQELISSGKIEMISSGKSGNYYRVEYEYTSTSVTAAFYALKEDQSVPTDEITSQSKENYFYVGSGVIDTDRKQIFGESNLPGEIQDFQFDLADDENLKYVWYVVKYEYDGWHVDGYIVNEEEIPAEEETTPAEEETTPAEEETTPAEEETTPVEEETTPAEEETTPAEEETTPAEEETTPAEEETTPAEEETTPAEEETTPAEEETTPAEEETTPAEEETTPAEEETTPAEEETTPVEPEEVPTEEFEDEVTPLEPPTEWVEFEDEETPLDNMPKTGSMNLVLPAMAVSCVALVVATVSKKKEDTAE
ncbi:MAG: hypothetical protein E7261_10230 [Lachnospiraceae bacterium]|nr:hypothetical protein [Lachnospiraceae bacterium]